MNAHKRREGKSDKLIPKLSKLREGKFPVHGNLNIDTEHLIPEMSKNGVKSSKSFKLLSNHPAFKGLKCSTPKEGSRLNGFLASGNDIGTAIKTARSRNYNYFLNLSLTQSLKLIYRNQIGSNRQEFGSKQSLMTFNYPTNFGQKRRKSMMTYECIQSNTYSQFQSTLKFGKEVVIKHFV